MSLMVDTRGSSSLLSRVVFETHRTLWNVINQWLEENKRQSSTLQLIDKLQAKVHCLRAT